VEGSKEDRLAMWGEAPISCNDVYEIFAKYIEGKIPILPWCESALQPETSTVSSEIAELNRRGFLSINSQPAVNGEKSDHPLYGWGGAGGRVYQKAYLEFFTSPDNLKLVKKILEEKPHLVFYAVDCQGTVCTSSTSTSTSSANGCKNVTALTWGVFPNKEILQPTIFDPNTFTVWSQEAFELWTNAWAALYDDASDSSALIYEVSQRSFTPLSSYPALFSPSLSLYASSSL
jgi:methylenetetrahydrofolate reductase (NADPH)